MSLSPLILQEQFQHACRHTPAQWVVSVVQHGENWEIDLTCGIQKRQRAVFEKFLDQAATIRWLEQALDRQSSYRTFPEDAAGVGAERLYAFPVSEPHKLLLVAGGALSKQDQKFFRSLYPVEEQRHYLKEAVRVPPPPSRTVGGALGLKETLQDVLITIVNQLGCCTGLLAVRAGDEFTIHAVCGMDVALLDEVFVAADRAELSEQIHRLQAFPFDGQIQLASSADYALSGQYWLGMPVVIGKRSIGIVMLGRDAPWLPEDLETASAIGAHIAPSVEKSILGVEAAYYLQRFALLNELASFASSGMTLPQVVQRGEAIFERAFGASLVQILLSDDNQGFTSFLENGALREQPINAYPLEKSVLEIGQVLRIGANSGPTKFASADNHFEARMAVPMRFRGKVSGVLSLSSVDPNAFTEQDEKFVPVAASQMASILTSLRLNDEMRRRAKAMQSVNDIVQVILGLSDVSLIAQRTAQLMAEKMAYGMVLVMLLDDQMDELIAEGVAGMNAADIPRGFRFSKNLGIPGHVMTYGTSVLLKDVRESEDYVPIPDWEPGSGIWVPLRSGKALFGVLSVEFQQKGKVDEDSLLVLEAIAGVLSSVISNARQYDQLQQSVSQLEAVRETALDIGADLDLQTLLRRVVNRVRKLLNAHGAELGFIDHENQMVEVLVSENPWQEYSGYRFKMNAGVTGKVAASGKALAVADFNSWSGRADSAFKAPFTTVAGVPLKLKGETIGTLVVQDDRPVRKFTQNDLRTLELLAPQLAIFIRNARLYQELETRMEAQRLAEERLIRSAKMAAVGEMAAAVAHELNNPLTTVTGFAELILEGMPKESPEYEDMSLVLGEAQRSRLVVRRLLDFSRQSELLRVDTDLNDVITVVLQLIHHLAQIGNIEVRMALWGDIPAIRADRNQIQQVILNIVHNAIQAMPDGGTLLVQSLLEMREGKPWLGIRVEDSGVGIDQDDLERIFEPFFTTKPSGEGTGLGLSVSYSIISEHGGYIDVSSTKGEGSTFTIWLPAQREEGQE